ncbi:MAG TPA: FecR domain-containing protein [Gemmatirosa sp.]|jgi:ferric-dicitrate binding protein FerR (iron transport regulator)|nr:FecR domain-containing protein [Gemmatirosa sp.]
MSATLQPYVDQELFAGIRRGDEAALQRLVLTRYEELRAEARQHLGTEADAAPRVVEHAILRLWRARERCEDAGAFDTSLHETIHDEAMRERSRSAARHRFEAHHHVAAHAAHVHGDAPAEEVWRRIADVLHHPPVDMESHHRHVRHEAAEHVARVGRRPPWAMPLVIGVVVGTLVLGGLYQVNKAGPEVAATRALASENTRVLSTRPAQEARVALNDGSTATLRPDTRVRVPPGFGNGTLRTVAMEGAATFAVKGGRAEPLSVRAGDSVEVRSSDGEFAVRAYPGERGVAIVALRGGLEVQASGTTRTLGANEAVLAGPGATFRALEGSARESALGWTTNTFVVEGQPLRAVLPQLKRWYDLTLEARPATLLDRTVTMRAPLGSPKGAIAALESAAGVRFAWDDRRMILTDAR